MRRPVHPVLLGLIVAVTCQFAFSTLRGDEAKPVEKPALETPPAPDKHTLRFQFQKGETAHYAVRQQNTMDIEYNEVTETAKSIANSIRHFKVLDVDDAGRATLELVIDRCYMSSTQEGATSIYDSTQPGEEVPPQFYQVAAMIGRPSAQIQVDPLGKVVGVTALLGQPTDKLDASDQKLDVLFALPEHPVAVGEQWSETLKTEVIVPPALRESVTMQRRYTLKAVEEGIATIAVRTLVLTPNIDAEKQTQLMQKLWQGEILFEVAAGRLLARRQTIDEQVAGFSNKTGLLTVQSVRLDQYAPVEKLAAIDLKSAK